jgi:hypothetical protein
MSVAKGNKSAYDFCTEAADNVVAVVTSLEQTHGIFRCSYNVLFTWVSFTEHMAGWVVAKPLP